VNSEKTCGPLSKKQFGQSLCPHSHVTQSVTLSVTLVV
jgi:hypothetical protein